MICNCFIELYLQLDVEAAPQPQVRGDAATAVVAVEIYFGDDQVDNIEKLLDTAIAENELSGKIHSELRSCIMYDLRLICGSKSLMYKKYSELLQKPYHKTSIDPPEGCIKKLLTDVIPKVILLRTKSEERNKTCISKQDTITADDAKVLKYIAGAVLRWGLKIFREEDAKWVATLISSSDTVAPEFVNNARGHLICPTQHFVSIIENTELQFRRYITSRSVDEQTIIDSVRLSEYVGIYFNDALEKLLRRFIRIRAHMHWRTLLLVHKQAKLKNRRSTALRKSLKNAHQQNNQS